MTSDKREKASGNQTDPCEIEFAILLFFTKRKNRKKKKIRENLVYSRDWTGRRNETRSREKSSLGLFRVEKVEFCREKTQKI